MSAKVNPPEPSQGTEQPWADRYRLLCELQSRIARSETLHQQFSAVLETVSVDLGYEKCALALIERDVLRMRMAVGFEDNQAIERIDMPLDSEAPGLLPLHTRQAVAIERKPALYAPFIGSMLEETDLLALPLLGFHRPSERRSSAGDLRREPGRKRPEAPCIGVLYLGIARPPSETENLFLRVLSESVGHALASAAQVQQMWGEIRRLQQERQWLESIMDSVTDPIILTNFDNQILLQNRRAVDLFSDFENANEGKRRALNLNDLLFSAYLSSVAVGSAAVTGRDLTLIDPIEGSDLHYEVVSTPALNAEGERIGVVSVFRDVTDVRRANDELSRNLFRLQRMEVEVRKERDRLDSVIENVGHPVVVTDASGNFILFNRRAEVLFQTDDLLEPAALAALRANSVKLTSFISGLSSEPQRSRQAEIQLIHPETRQLIPMEVTSVKVHDSSGQISAVVSVLHDLTTIKELERRRLEQRLFQSEKLAAVGRLAASIAHEINNPLEAIKNSLHLLRSSEDRDSDSKFLDIAAQETERVSHIIRQMLGFARSSGSREWVDVNKLLDETLVLVEKKLRNSGIRVVRSLQPELPMIHAWPDQLRQVFLNLVLNSQQAIERKGRIKVRTAPARGRLPSVLVEITDSGRGIEPEHMSRIFEPFFSTRKRGTGLGLWVSHDIVRRHGGRISVSSKVGRGTTFHVVLPIDSPEQESNGEVSNDAEEAGSDARV